MLVGSKPKKVFYHKEHNAAKPQPKKYFTTETQSSQRSEYFLIKNSLLCALSASAVSHPKRSCYFTSPAFLAISSMV